MTVAAIHRGATQNYSRQCSVHSDSQQPAGPSETWIVLADQSLCNSQLWTTGGCTVTGAGIFRSSRINLLTLWQLWFYRDQNILFFLSLEITRWLSVHDSDYFVHIKICSDVNHPWYYVLVNNFEALFWSLSSWHSTRHQHHRSTVLQIKNMWS